ncbi:lipid A export permease/ATP-binding protein MsbA [Luteitalea sp.]|uniref:lipid A export permease/ATP-binding protein MsbA n=1 Tax=Luteitalea sp. TaxID=2004800 RepID=UPI0037C561A9
MTVLLRLLRYARPYRAHIAAAFVAMVAYGAASAGVVYLIKPIFDQALGNQAELPTIALAIVGVYLVKGLGAYLSAYMMTDVGQRVVRDIRNQMFGHVLGQSAAFFSRRSTGQLLSRVNNDVNQVQQVVSQTIGDIIREGFALVGYIGLLFYHDARLALVSLTGAPVLIYPLVRLGQRVRRRGRRSQEQLEVLTHITAEAFGGHRIVKAFGAEAREQARFEDASHRVYRTNMQVTSTVSALPPLMEWLGGIAVAAMLWYGASQIGQGRLTMGEFMLFVTTLFLMYEPIKRLSRVNATLQQAMAAAQRIFELLDTHTEVTDRPGAVPMPRPRTAVEFRDVSFAYADRDKRTVLDGVSFRVEAGEIVAIVGLSGAGKTTLVNLLPRFYDVTDGAILIDGLDIRDATLASLRAHIGLVTQETVLFDDTIANNIAYGRPTASPAEIEAAARAAHAHEFIATLPERYETRIGERGGRLSGGQRQRLAIARAILKDSPILVLDEATSSLDAESERLVQDALQALMRNRTSFVIAHRLSTVRSADRIIVLEDGRIVETGRHDDLLARPGGVYSRLYALQMFGNEAATEPAGAGEATPATVAVPRPAAGQASAMRAMEDR